MTDTKKFKVQAHATGLSNVIVSCHATLEEAIHAAQLGVATVRRMSVHEDIRGTMFKLANVKRIHDGHETTLTNECIAWH
jgi:hypothetical protein